MTRFSLGQAVLARTRDGDGTALSARPLSMALSLGYTITASVHSAALPISYSIQARNTASLFLYYQIAVSPAFAINGSSAIIRPDHITYTLIPVVNRTLLAQPVLQGYWQMSWSYQVLRISEYQTLLSFYNPQNPFVLVTYPDEQGTWQQKTLGMHPPTYGQQETLFLNNVTFSFFAPASSI